MKTFLKIFLGFLGILIIGIGVFFLTFDLNTYRGLITEKLSAALGRSVTIESMEMKLSMIPTIKIRNIRVSNPSEFMPDSALATVDTAEATLAIAPLFSRRLEIQNVALGKTTVNLTQKNGRNNWTLGTDKSERTPPTVITDDAASSGGDWLDQMRVDNISAKSVSVAFSSDTTTQNITLSDMSVKQLKVFSLNVQYDNKVFQISGTVNDMLDLIRRKPDYLFNLEITGLDATAKVSGRIGDTTRLRELVLKTTVSGANLNTLATQLGVENPLIPTVPFEITVAMQGNPDDIQITEMKMQLGGTKLVFAGTGTVTSPGGEVQATLDGTVRLTDAALGAGWGIKPFNATFAVTATPKLMTLTNLTLMANRSDVQVSGTLQAGKIPTLTATVASEYLDTLDLLADKPVYIPAPGTPKVVPTVAIADKPVDLSVLKRMNATLTLNMPHIKATDAVIGYLGAVGTVSVQDGVLTTSDLRLDALNGTMTVRASAAASDSINTVSVQAKGQNLSLDSVKALQPLIRDGQVDFDATLKARGNTVKALLGTLNGTIWIEIPQGTIINEWFNSLPAAMGMIRSRVSSVAFSTTDRESKILCGAVNLRVKDGQIISDDKIAIETSTINFLISGTVNLAQETLNLSMLPSVNDATMDSVLSAAQFVKITGTFLKPTAALDGEKLVQQAAQKGLEKLIAKQMGGKTGLKTKSQQESATTAPYLLCQKVLGRQTRAQVAEQSKKKQVLTLPKTTVEKPQPTRKPTPREQFREQLLKSLSDALQ